MPSLPSSHAFVPRFTPRALSRVSFPFADGLDGPRDYATGAQLFLPVRRWPGDIAFMPSRPVLIPCQSADPTTLSS